MAIITEDYCSFEVAKLLKEKGFDGDTSSCYILEDGTHHIMNDKVVQSEYYESQDSNEHGHLIQAPTHQMAMKWLREVHNLFIEPYAVKNYSKKKLEYTYSIQDLDFQGSDDGIECCKNWDTLEQACEIAIKYCLEKLI